MKLNKHVAATLVALGMTTACQPSSNTDTSSDVAETKVTPVAEQKSAPVAEETSVSPELGTFGVDLDAIDATVKPGDNFFKHVIHFRFTDMKLCNSSPASK